jgi:hypothetical protein
MPNEQVFIEVEGIEDVVDALTTAPRSAIPSALVRGLAAGGAVIEEYMTGRIPDKTGQMLEDLGTTVTLDADFRGGIAAVGFGSKQGPIAGWVEYGHRMIGHAPVKKQEGQVEPRPFMRPAAEASAEEAVEVLGDTLLDTLAQAEVIDAA